MTQPAHPHAALSKGEKASCVTSLPRPLRRPRVFQVVRDHSGSVALAIMLDKARTFDMQ